MVQGDIVPLVFALGALIGVLVGLFLGRMFFSRDEREEKERVERLMYESKLRHIVNNLFEGEEK